MHGHCRVMVHLTAFATIFVAVVACGDVTSERTAIQPDASIATAAPPAAPSGVATAGATVAPSPSATAGPSVVGDEERDMDLIAAAAAGDLEDVNQLLRQGASVDARDGRGRTALIAAAYGDHLAVAEALIAAGADVNVKDDTQQSAYLIPTADGSLAMLRLALRSGADVHSLDSYNGTGLIRAADRGHVEIIRELLTTPIAIDHVNRLGWTALLEAIILGRGDERHTEVVRLLVAAGANVNLADGNGVTPLAHARQRGQAAIAEILLQAGARPQ
ncbi:MAG: ankyrin repeat domain-containing protein [Dehalococcoidia bacterium]